MAERFVGRCSDRQNWLFDVGAHYTGTFLPEDYGVSMPIKGTKEASSIFTDERGTCMAIKLNFPFTCNDMVLTESLLEDKYTSALWADVGCDAMPSRPSQTSDVYKGRMRWYNFTQDIPGNPWVTLVEYDLVLKRDVEPVNPAGLFPIFQRAPGKNSAFWDGKQVIVSPMPKGGIVDVPPGSMAGGFIALSDGLQIQNGNFGMAPQKGNPAKLAVGTRLTARFLIGWKRQSIGSMPKANKFDDKPDEWLKAMGFAGPTPYQINLTRGKLDKMAFIAEMTPDNYGVAGQIAAPANIPYQIPLQIKGANERWVAGIWREDTGISYTGILEGSAWPRLDVSKPVKFYAGNLLVSDNKDLVLDFVKWTKDAVKVEVHNPTDKPIDATVLTPKEITDYKSLNKKVSVPPGTTIYIEDKP